MLKNGKLVIRSRVIFIFILGFSSFLQRKSTKYLSFISCWVAFSKPLLIVRYENIKKTMNFELRKILNFLNIHVSNQVLKCVENNTGEIWHRKPSVFNPYSTVNNKVLLKLNTTETLVEKAISKICFNC